MIIDSHCHLNYQPLITDIKKVISRAQKVGVKYFLTICTTDENFKDVLSLTSKFDNIFGMFENCKSRKRIKSKSRSLKSRSFV